ncbi:MAG: hypothetical protein MHPSP_001468, partial [Paramarteilia canceri]
MKPARDLALKMHTVELIVEIFIKMWKIETAMLNKIDLTKEKSSKTLPIRSCSSSNIMECKIARLSKSSKETISSICYALWSLSCGINGSGQDLFKQLHSDKVLTIISSILAINDPKEIFMVEPVAGIVEQCAQMPIFRQKLKKIRIVESLVSHIKTERLSLQIYSMKALHN